MQMIRGETCRLEQSWAVDRRPASCLEAAAGYQAWPSGASACASPTPTQTCPQTHITTTRYPSVQQPCAVEQNSDMEALFIHRGAGGVSHVHVHYNIKHPPTTAPRTDPLVPLNLRSPLPGRDLAPGGGGDVAMLRPIPSIMCGVRRWVRLLRSSTRWWGVSPWFFSTHIHIQQREKVDD